MELLLPILLLAVFYLFLIRPQQRRAKEASAMQRSLQPGDEVMLTSGFFGTVVSIDEEEGRLEVSLAPGTVVTVVRGAVGQVVPPEEPVEDDLDDTDDAALGETDPADEPGGEPGTPGTKEN
ncbi:preprotein translocase subunit YajC [Nocardioides bruguierae]|uniref:Preprotein translocase subunit YajC n=1 Tax=Nocardioides bruguierae TaxID=2945102 RepID=A0A9X2DA31_9ACTN|nr:preprotein translocase subunit YajC [Nocardioides bruguierae]MCL8027378.1 preprotein translocase subunit YajC [Nocardioides bruguierae]MCM0622092.1 preprotein translocase subunit YajC [Nocardioides bruguierae]